MGIIVRVPGLGWGVINGKHGWIVQPEYGSAKAAARVAQGLGIRTSIGPVNRAQ